MATSHGSALHTDESGITNTSSEQKSRLDFRWQHYVCLCAYGKSIWTTAYERGKGGDRYHNRGLVTSFDEMA